MNHVKFKIMLLNCIKFVHTKTHVTLLFYSSRSRKKINFRSSAF